MKKQPKTSKPTFESVWALTQENAIALKETRQILRENAAEAVRRGEEADRRGEEADRRGAEADQRMKELQKTFGSWGNNLGSFAEEYFVNSFKKGEQNFFGEKFDELKRNRNGIVTDDEYDILLINGRSVCIIETKFKAHVNDIPEVLNKVQSFRLNFPQFKNYSVYLGLASMAFNKKVESKCKENGIAIIKQVGDKVVIIDEGLKTY